MTQSLYDRLIATLDAFIDEFGGDMRLRRALTSLLILRTSLFDRGISISEVRQVTGAPLESIRRHVTESVDAGHLITRPDPDDERVTRYLVSDLDWQRDRARRIAVTLHGIGPPGSGCSRAEGHPQPFSAATCDALIDVLRAFTGFMDGGMRIRAFKVAVILLQASLIDEGITASQIARVSGAAQETVRRTLHKYVEKGDLTAADDPYDERAIRLLYPNPDVTAAAIKRIADKLDGLDWAVFNMA